MVTVIVDIDNAVATEVGLKNVCLGPTGTEHVPTAVKQQPLKCPASYTDANGRAVDCNNDDPTTMKKANVVGDQFMCGPVGVFWVRAPREATVPGRVAARWPRPRRPGRQPPKP